MLIQQDKTHSLIIGVDPGGKGGIAGLACAQGAASPRLVFGLRMPLVRHQTKATVDARGVAGQVFGGLGGGSTSIVIEAVHSMPKQGVASAFQFGRVFGAIEALALASGHPVHYVTPAKWKGALGLTKDKRASIDKARQLFGEDADQLLKHLADDGIAEAALIAYHWWMNNNVQRP